jgi:hypothetical protein
MTPEYTIFDLQVKTQATLEKLRSHLVEEEKSRLKDEQQIIMLELKVKTELLLNKMKKQFLINRIKT